MGPPVVEPMSPEPPLPVSPPPLRRSNRDRDRVSQAAAIKERRKQAALAASRATAASKASTSDSNSGAGADEVEDSIVETPKKSGSRRSQSSQVQQHEREQMVYTYAEVEDDMSITPIEERPETSRSLLQASSSRLEQTRIVSPESVIPRSATVRSKKLAHAKALVKQRNESWATTSTSASTSASTAAGSSANRVTPQKASPGKKEAVDTPATQSVSSAEGGLNDSSILDTSNEIHAKAYNRFFPPKPVETHDVFGVERVLSLEPLDTGDVEVYREERYYANSNDDGTYAASQWDMIADLAKKEWDVGTDDNTRYGSPSRYDAGPDGCESVASLPSILDRSEVFHEDAAQAIVALLSPNRGRGGSSSSRGGGGNADVGLETKDDDDVSASGVSFFSSLSHYSTNGGGGGEFSSNTRGMWDTTSQFSDARDTPLLSAETEALVDAIPGRMRQPSKQIGDLVTVIHSMDSDANTNEVASRRGYMTRRKNACGALKVLAAKQRNKVSLCWTYGVLSSIASVLGDSAFDYVDKATYDAFIEARKRAVAALVSMSVEAENRVVIFHSPGLVHSLTSTMNEDEGESRQGCCACLTYLSKTPANRLLMVQAPGLVSAVVDIIRTHMEGEDDDNDTAAVENKENKSQSLRMYMKEFAGSRESAMSTVASADDNDTLVQKVLSSEALDTAPSVADTSMDTSDYDSDPNKFLHGARLNVFATLLNLTKEKDNAYDLARNTDLTSVLIEVSNLHSSPSHTRALAVLAHFTRHRDNTKHMCFRLRKLLPTLVHATKSDADASRKYAAQAIQNLSGDRHCRQEVANAHDLIESLCSLSLRDSEQLTRHAAVGALNNLTDEPANLIPMTNAKDCFATLMLLSHGEVKGATDMMQYMAKDALATLSYWLRKVATKATMSTATASVGGRKRKELYVPKIETVGYKQWK